MKLKLNFLKTTLLKHYPVFLFPGIALVLLVGFYLSNSPIQQIQATSSCDLVMQVSPSGAGTTEPAKGDNWYECNQYIGIAAHPASGYAFDYWAGDVSGTSNPTTIWLDKNKVASAHFKTTTPCSCGDWVGHGCGSVGCGSQYLGFTRSCNPSGCDQETKCVYDVTCGAAVCGNGICETGENNSTCPNDCPPPSNCNCTSWTSQGCGGAGCASQYLGYTRSCNPSGCAAEKTCVYDVTCGAAVCGNGICETGENNSTCPGDCPVVGYRCDQVGCSPGATWCLSNNYCLYTSGGACQYGNYCPPSGTKSGDTCYYQKVGCNSSGQCNVQTCILQSGQTCNATLGCVGGGCTNDCSTPGAKRCDPANNTRYQICGQYDTDKCLDWAPAYSCPSGQTCSGAGICGGATCNCTWVNQGCGGAGCPKTQRGQTRACPSTGCQIETRCLAYSVCALSIPSPATLISPIGNASNVGNCVPEGAEVTFDWTPANPTGQTVQEQWLDLTTNNGIFTEPCTSNIPPYSPTGCFVHVQLNNWQNSYIAKVGNPLGPLKPGIKHWWRINTKIGGEWYPSKSVEAFTTNSCGTLNCPSVYGRCEVPTMGWCSPTTLSQYFHNNVCQASAICYQESTGDPCSQNPRSGARGLFQIMPDTAASNGIDYNRLCNPGNCGSCDPVYDIRAAVKITEDGTYWQPWAGPLNPVGWCPITF